VITGPNGSGKTSLIEAVYIALQGKSWRSSFSEMLHTEQDIVAEWWRIDMEFSDGEKRTVKYTGTTKEFIINGTIFSRLPNKFKKPVVLFEPNDLQLLYGSPTRRRDFFDRFIVQTDPGYSGVLRKFNRVLQQRNNLLKKGAIPDELFVWDVQFAELAEKIITARATLIEKINTNLNNYYQDISDTNDSISVRYNTPQKTSEQILRQLANDIYTHPLFTKTGPQSHDILFKINDRNAKKTASRGENRTILFGVLGAITDTINQLLGEEVYLIFDDVDSELDAARKNKLYHTKIFSDNYLYATTIKADGQSINYLPLG
jgi:DNA replication and repair protein RecF